MFAHDDRLTVANHLLDQRTFHANRHAMHVIGRRASRRAHRQFFLLFIHQQNRANRGIECLRHHLRNRLQNPFQVAFRRNRLRYGGQRFEAANGALRLFRQTRAANTPPICSPINVTIATSSEEC